MSEKMAAIILQQFADQLETEIDHVNEALEGAGVSIERMEEKEYVGPRVGFFQLVDPEDRNNPDNYKTIAGDYVVLLALHALAGKMREAAEVLLDKSESSG